MSEAKNTLRKPVEDLKDETAMLTPPSDTGHSKEEAAPGKFIVHSHFKGQDFIHIREVGNMRGHDYLTRKGVSLIPDGLNTLRVRNTPIDNLLVQPKMDGSCGAKAGEENPLYKLHLGIAPFATDISTFTVENGIHIPVAHWSAFDVELGKLYTAYIKLNKAVECCMSHGANQMEFFNCDKCWPFGHDVVD